MPFSQFALNTTLQANIAQQGYSQPTDIQRQAIPVVLEGQDVMAAAATGTGKTASFVLPLLEQLSQLNEAPRPKHIRALILIPTRELAVQVQTAIEQFSQGLNIRSLAMIGGDKYETQKQQLIDGVDILVATPGRLLDMAYQRAIRFNELSTLILDEADRMLDMGFIGDINKIIERLPSSRQTLLFSATLSDPVRQLVHRSITNAIEITIAPEQTSHANINQWLITVDKDTKSNLLSHLIKDNAWQQALIFIRTKHGAAKLANQLEKRGIDAQAIHSDKSQAARTQLLADFKSGKIAFLVATDIAARGIDIEDLTRVVNYDLPNDANDYIHRVGRTGRAGKQGEAVSLVSKDDFKSLCAIESRLGHIITRNELEEFKPRKEVPISILNYVPKNQRPESDGKKANNQANKKTADRAKKNDQHPSKPKNKPAKNEHIWGKKK